jgi:tetratricopeptide (TPR) repeat protein
VLVALGDLERGGSRSRRRRTHYARALELAPSSYDALYGVGACDFYEREHAKAIESFRRALRVAPDSAPALLALGISLLQSGQAAAAVPELEAAVKLEPRMRQALLPARASLPGARKGATAAAAFARAQELAREGRDLPRGSSSRGPTPVDERAEAR